MSRPRNYFEGPDPIFHNKDLLQISHLPKGERIIGRDEQMSNLANVLRPATKGNDPNNAFIYGKTGTGKSLCAKFLSRQLVETAAKNDVTVGFAYIDCLQDSTETQVIQSAGRILNDRDETDVYFPGSGVPTSDYYNRLWTVLDTMYDAAIIILDELDKLSGVDDILRLLPAAGEAEKIRHCKLGVIGISNKTRFKDTLGDRAKSALCDREFVFPPYDAGQLREILHARQDAFKDGVLTDDVVPLAAALAGQEYGDARQAIDIIRFAGEIAQEANSDVVKKEHVERAHHEAEKNQLHELMQELTPQSHRVLRSLAILDRRTRTDRPVKSTEVYSMYVQLSETLGSRVLSQRRVRDLLGELEFLEIIEQRRKGAGRGEGGYMENHLLDDTETVLEVLNESTDHDPEELEDIEELEPEQTDATGTLDDY